MKKLFLSVCICLIAFVIHAQQQPKEIVDFNTYTNNIENQRQEAQKIKNYPVAEKVIREWISKYNASSATMQKKFMNYQQEMYYNLACYVNLQGRRNEALSDLEKCVSLGYANYSDTKVDTDLESLHSNPRFKAALEKLRERGDMNFILQQSGPYNLQTSKNLPSFTYQAANAPQLVALKKKFNLDSISGNGDEISKFKKLLLWVHNSVQHDGISANPDSKNAVDIIEICKKQNRGVNCRMMATILRDVYQAEGYPTRVVTCMPKDTLDTDCHVITVVWSKTLNKWVWMDPTFNAYVTDAKGNLLNIEEVRERLVKGGDDLLLNQDANRNNQNKETKEDYLGYYMSKNLYWLYCATKSEWDIETVKPGKPAVEYINLFPGTFTTLHTSGGSVKKTKRFSTYNPVYFWQKPANI